MVWSTTSNLFCPPMKILLKGSQMLTRVSADSFPGSQLLTPFSSSAYPRSKGKGQKDNTTVGTSSDSHGNLSFGSGSWSVNWIKRVHLGHPLHSLRPSGSLGFHEPVRHFVWAGRRMPLVLFQHAEWRLANPPSLEHTKGLL